MDENEKEEFSKFLRYCKNGDITELKKLPSKYAKEILVFPGNEVTSPLFEAIFEGEFQIVKYLLEKGADPNYYGNYDYPYLGAVPLHIVINRAPAQMENDIFWKVTNELLKHGANPNIPNYREETPLDWVIRFENKALEKLLLENGAKHSKNYLKNKDKYLSRQEIKILVNARENQDLKTIKEVFLDKGRDIDVNTSPGGFLDSTFLEGAIIDRKSKVVKFLLENGANPNRLVMGKSYIQVYLEDLQNDFMEDFAGKKYPPTKILELLIKYGIDVNRENREGYTPLDYLYNMGGETKVEDILLAAGAKNSKKFLDEREEGWFKWHEEERQRYIKLVENYKYLVDLKNILYDLFEGKKVKTDLFDKLPYVHKEILLSGIGGMVNKATELKEAGYDLNVEDDRGFTTMDLLDHIGGHGYGTYEEEKKLEELGLKRSKLFQ